MGSLNVALLRLFMLATFLAFWGIVLVGSWWYIFQGPPLRVHVVTTPTVHFEILE